MSTFPGANPNAPFVILIHTNYTTSCLPVNMSALIVDLKKTLTFSNSSTELKSIYFGGGTPNLFPPDAFKTLLDNIHGECDFTDVSKSL